MLCVTLTEKKWKINIMIDWIDWWISSKKKKEKRKKVWEVLYYMMKNEFIIRLLTVRKPKNTQFVELKKKFNFTKKNCLDAEAKKNTRIFGSLLWRGGVFKKEKNENQYLFREMAIVYVVVNYKFFLPVLHN